jgi:GDP-mannose 6-dehydrogenase
MILATGTRNVGVIGLAFKAGTDDLRESPVVSLIEMLLGKGLTVSIYDPNVSAAAVFGANRKFIEREIPHIWTLLLPSIEETLKSAEVVVVANDLAEIGQSREHFVDKTVIDLARAFRQKPDGVRYEGISW